jgi:ribose transport system permease protein
VKTNTDTAVRKHGIQFQRQNVLAFLRDYAVVLLLIILVIVMSFFSPSFLTFPNIMNILQQNATLAIIAVAGTFVIISANFDLSTASIFSVGSVVAAWMVTNGFSVTEALFFPAIVGTLLGAVNGIIVTKLKVHSFLATLATGMVFSSIAVLITKGNLIPISNSSFTNLGRGKFAGVYNSVWFLIIVFIAATLLLEKTRFGRHVFGVGGNEKAAELSGINVDNIKILVFVLSGLASGIASSIGVSRIASGQPLAGQGLETQAIAAVVLGGTSILGGVGAVWRSLIGVYLMALIGNAFDLMNFNPQIKDLVTGVIIIFAISVSMIGKRKE